MSPRWLVGYHHAAAFCGGPTQAEALPGKGSLVGGSLAYIGTEVVALMLSESDLGTFFPFPEEKCKLKA